MSVSNHDPLCRAPECDFGDNGGLGDCLGWDDCHHDCMCRFIAKVRADERERAAQRMWDWHAPQVVSDNSHDTFLQLQRLVRGEASDDASL